MRDDDDTGRESQSSGAGANVERVVTGGLDAYGISIVEGRVVPTVHRVE